MNLLKFLGFGKKDVSVEEAEKKRKRETIIKKVDKILAEHTEEIEIDEIAVETEKMRQGRQETLNGFTTRVSDLGKELEEYKKQISGNGSSPVQQKE